MQHGAEHLALDVGDAVDFDQRGGDERALRRLRRQGGLGHAEAARAHGFDMAQNAVARLGRDDGADVGRELARVADREFRQRAAQHGQRALGRLLLQAQDAQGRAALPRGIERGGDHVADHLLGERRGIDDHRVEPAGLGDQRNRLAGAGEPPRERARDQPRDRRRAGEDHALHAGILDQRGADLACAGNELQRLSRHAGFVQQPHGFGGDQRGLLGGLGDHDIARRQRRRDLSGEDRQREVPGADAGETPNGAARPAPAAAPRLAGVIAQEIDGLAQLATALA